MNKFKIEQRSIAGIFIILVGTILLLSSMDIISADLDIGTFWPIILIVIGVIRIINFDQSTFFGVILVLIGVFFQLRNLDVPFMENASFSKIFWPGVVILFGASLILPDKYKSHKNNDSSYDYSNNDNSVDVDHEEEYK